MVNEERKRADAAVLALGVCGVFAALSVLGSLGTVALSLGGPQGTAYAAHGASSMFGSVRSLASLVTAVFFLRWLHYCYETAHLWTQRPLGFSASNACWSFFIPFLNLVQPPMVLRALWLASDPSELPNPTLTVVQNANAGYRDGAVVLEDRPLVRQMGAPIVGWWVTYMWLPVAIAACNFAITIFGFGRYANDGYLLSRSAMSGVTAIANLAAAVLAVMIVRSIDARIRERVRRIAAAPQS